jgi:hypothetical protein
MTSDTEGNSFSNQPFENRERQVYGATIGWRLQHDSGLFLDAGIGMSVQIFHRNGIADTADGLRKFDERRVGPGWVWRPGTVPYPDVDFAIGFEF